MPHVRVTEFVEAPPDRVWAAHLDGTHGTATLLLRPEAGATHLDLDVAWGLSLGRLGRWLERLTAVRRRAARDMRGELRAFRAFAERYPG
jgi:hypothetical protein